MAEESHDASGNIIFVKTSEGGITNINMARQGDFVGQVGGDFVGQVGGDFVGQVGGDFVGQVGGDFNKDVHGNINKVFGCSSTALDKAQKAYFFQAWSGSSYDVFLSFKGEDTRKTFTDHLYTALGKARFRTFQYGPELERGENIKQKLEKAIQQSRSSVIVFSKDSTSSKWYLDDLVMILERKNSSDHVFLPVFYDVEPSEVWKQAENLAKVPKYQENQSTEKLNGWRAALREVADLPGMVLQNEADGHESKFIQNIVKVIQDKLGRLPLSVVQDVLQKKLSSVDPILDDAEGKQLNNQTVKDWLNDLKEAVYDAEDLLQEIKTEALRQKMEPESPVSSTSTGQELVSSPPSHAFDSALINSRVEVVLERLDCIQKEGKDVLGLEASAGHRVSQTIPSTSLVEDSGVYGRDEEKEVFIKLLLSDDMKISVIPIVGMGGIGKTTLAQLLYNDVRVEQHFDLHAWAYVSEEFDVLRISQHIYESLTSDTCQIVNLNLLQKKLKAAVEGKKFLFVLDDIWNKNYNPWDSLRRPFESGAHGSKIIVTARNIDVASMVGTVQPHSLMPISEQDGWLLFEKHAFKNSGVGEHSNLEAIGRQIVRNCKGLPLALKSLGGLSCSNLSVREWENISNSDIWDVESNIMPALLVSYRYLPLCLKRCFAYCSIFPEGYEFEKSELLSLWKAEGLIQRTKTKVEEEVGEDYFNDLVSKSFFQPYLLQTLFNKPYYIMHDLINDLAKFVSRDFCVSWEDSESSNVVTSKTRHFSYMKRHAESYEKFEALHEAIYLRTFLPLTRQMRGYPYLMMDKVLYDLLPKLRCLRVLNLSEYDISALPDSINNLKHLRRLNMSLTSIRKLPDTICSLYNLQVLLLSDCRSLTALPTKLGRLTNLSHLDIKGTNLKKMPAHMGNLKDLQILNEFVLDEHTGDSILELKKLQNLRGRLCISGLGNIVNGSALEANFLKDKKFLTELVLDWGSPRTIVDTQIASEVLDKLQPHAKLEHLSIRQYRGTNFPDWSRYFAFSTLAYFQLEECLNCTSLPPLGQLQSLRELDMNRLHAVKSMGPEFYGGIKPFSSLQVLSVGIMNELEEWSYVGDVNDERGVFPNLRELSLLDCDKLTGKLAFDKFPILEFLDLENTKLSFAISRCPKLLALTRLTLFDCPAIVSFPDQGLDAPNLTEINIRSCQNLRSLPEKMHTLLPSLQHLRITFCPQLESVPEGGLPSKLESLEILSCKELIANRMQWGLQRLTSLVRLSLGFRGCQQVVDSFPEEGDNLPRTLTHLSIQHLSNLKTINQKGFGHLDSLQSLEIINCPALKCLPGERLPTSLISLSILNCPLVKELADWSKISIRNIKVDEKRI